MKAILCIADWPATISLSTGNFTKSTGPPTLGFTSGGSTTGTAGSVGIYISGMRSAPPPSSTMVKLMESSFETFEE